MKLSLDEQYVLVKPLEPMEVLNEMLEVLGIEERGGGCEGIYYTHALLGNEYLFRSLPTMLIDLQIATNKDKYENRR